RDRCTVHEMYDMILLYAMCGRQSRETARIYARRYPERRQLHHSIFMRLESRLRKDDQFRPIKRTDTYLFIRSMII
ncbi:hypothetical protein X777_14105, partial [Ooceraea biroi]